MKTPRLRRKRQTFVILVINWKLRSIIFELPVFILYTNEWFRALDACVDTISRIVLQNKKVNFFVNCTNNTNFFLYAYNLQQKKVTDIILIRRDRILNKWLCEWYVPSASIWLSLGGLWHSHSSRRKRQNGGRTSQTRCVSCPPAMGTIIWL